VRAEAQSFGFRSSEERHTDTLAACRFFDNHALELHCVVATIKQNAKPHCVLSNTGDEDVGTRLRQGLGGNRTSILAWI